MKTSKINYNFRLPNPDSKLFESVSSSTSLFYSEVNAIKYKKIIVLKYLFKQ